MTDSRPMTADDIIGMVAATQQWQPGDYIEPLVGGGPLRDRLTMRVIAREERQGRLGTSVIYRAVDAAGVEHEVWASDDPRASSAERFGKDAR